MDKIEQQRIFIGAKVRVKPTCEHYDKEYDEGRDYYVTALYCDSGGINIGIADQQGSMCDADGFYYDDLEIIEQANLIPLDQIHFCGKCNDSGYEEVEFSCEYSTGCVQTKMGDMPMYYEGICTDRECQYYKDKDGNSFKEDAGYIPCPCREIPHSCWSIKERAKR